MHAGTDEREWLVGPSTSNEDRELDPERDAFLGICAYFQAGLGKQGDRYQQWERRL